MIRKPMLFALCALLCASMAACAPKVSRAPETPHPSIQPLATHYPVTPSPAPTASADANKGQMPVIPPVIARGENQEPVLSVYVIERDQIVEEPLEEYITSVIAGEMKNDWPAAALEAQAILARTFVLQFIEEKGGSRYGNAHVSTDIEEAQAYDPDNVNDAIRAAIEKTRGQVLVYENGFVRGWFHAHAAGITALAKEGLAFEGEEPPYIQVIQSPDSPDAPKEEVDWTARIPLDKALEAARNVSGNTALESLQGLTISEFGNSGRAVTLKTASGDTLSAPAFRMALGSMVCRSTLIHSIKIEGEELVIAGKGYGHGVGMSQWGAYAMAKEGKTAEDILNYYFKDVRVEQLWQ